MRDLSPRIGTHVVTRFHEEAVRAFVPPPLPPNPPIDSSPYLGLLEQANQALGRLDGLASVLPNVSLLIYMYIRKEAVLSSQIEGTQSSLSDLLMFETAEAPGVPVEDVREVSHCVSALATGVERLRSGFPLSLRLIREIHGVLLAAGRGSDKLPGEFRRSQNWIGGTRPGNAGFVPPPPDRLMECLGALELFLHEERPDLPLLFKAALAHVQFETIHPFLDGNGRVGRLLITLQLCAAGVIREPILYLSLYFKENRARYYQLLDRVRSQGDWESWIEFFLTGVRDTANEAASATRRILTLFEADRRRIEELGRPAASALRLHQHMHLNPIFSIQTAAEKLGLTPPTLAASIGHLRKLGMVREITGKQRRRLFVYERYLQILNQGTERIAAAH